MIDSKWLQFDKCRDSPSGKTSLWEVTNKENGSLLGSIKWWGAWRQYVFLPADDCVFNRGCLRDLAAFLDEAMAARDAAAAP